MEDVDAVGERAVVEGELEVLAGDLLFESDVEFGVWLGVSDDPHFGFWFAAELFCEVSGWVDLDGEIVCGVENFDEDGEAFGIGQGGTENFLAVILPQFVEGFADV